MLANEYQKHYLEHCGDSTLPSSTLPDSYNLSDLKAPVVRILPRYGTTVTPLLIDSLLSNQSELKNGIISIPISTERSDTSSIGTMGKNIAYTYKITLASFYLPKLYENENQILGIDIAGSTDVSQFSYKYVAVKIVGFESQGISTIGNLINPIQFHFLCNVKFDSDLNCYVITPLKEFEELIFSTPQTYINSIKLELSNGFRTLNLPRCTFTNVQSDIFDSMYITWFSGMKYDNYGELILGYNLQKYRELGYSTQSAPVILNSSGIMEFINLSNNINSIISCNFNLSKYLDISGGYVNGYYDIYNTNTMSNLNTIFTNLARFTRVKYYSYDDIVYYNPLISVSAIKNSNIYYDSYNKPTITNNTYEYLNRYGSSDYYISDIDVGNYNKLSVTIHRISTSKDILLRFLYGINDIYDISTIFSGSLPVSIESSDPAIQYNESGYFVRTTTTSGIGFIIYTQNYPINNVFINIATSFDPLVVYDPISYPNDLIAFIKSNIYNNINIIGLQNYDITTTYKIFFNQINNIGLYLYLETDIDSYSGYSEMSVDINWSKLKYNDEILSTTYLQRELLEWYKTYLINNVRTIKSYEYFVESSRAIYKIDSPYWIINDQSDYYWDIKLFSDPGKTITVSGLYLGFRNKQPTVFSFTDPSIIYGTFYFNGDVKGVVVNIPEYPDIEKKFTITQNSWIKLNNGPLVTDGNNLWYTNANGLSEYVSILRNLNFIKLSMDNMIICDQRILMMMKMFGYNVNTPITNGCLPTN